MKQNISTKEQLKIWSHVAINSFGGPAGQIAVIHKLVVEDKKLISEERFLHALNFCMLLPGPEAQQLATYMGWLMNKWKGGLIAGGLFILPGFLSILLLSYLYVIFQDTSIIDALFYGIKPAVIAIVSAALLRISKKSLNTTFYWMIAIAAFVAIFFFNISFPIVVLCAAILGVIYGKLQPQHHQKVELATLLPSTFETCKTVSTWLLIWIAPIMICIALFGSASTFHTLNLFFSKMSMVTFGGAYAALSYVAQLAVETYGWLEGTEMLDGLAMAETTPGPLIQVVQFVGFMGAYRFSDLSNPYLSAFVGSVLTTWMTFAPCFLWIFTFAPYVEFIRGKKVFADGLKSITSSVVGVIAQLSLWFILKVLFLENISIKNSFVDFDYPVLSSIDFYAAAICLMAMVMQFAFKKSLFFILSTCTLTGFIIHWLR
jgi:chromate transporter